MIGLTWILFVIVEDPDGDFESQLMECQYHYRTASDCINSYQTMRNMFSIPTGTTVSFVVEDTPDDIEWQGEEGQTDEGYDSDLETEDYNFEDRRLELVWRIYRRHSSTPPDYFRTFITESESCFQSYNACLENFRQSEYANELNQDQALEFYVELCL